MKGKYIDNIFITGTRQNLAESLIVTCSFVEILISTGAFNIEIDF